MTCPHCKCPECAKVELNAVLRSHALARETVPEMTDSELVKAFSLLAQSRRFAEPRELGKPLVDPDAEQLAGDVAREMARAG